MYFIYIRQGNIRIIHKHTKINIHCINAYQDNTFYTIITNT